MDVFILWVREALIALNDATMKNKPLINIKSSVKLDSYCLRRIFNQEASKTRLHSNIICDCNITWNDLALFHFSLCLI